VKTHLVVMLRSAAAGRIAKRIVNVAEHYAARTGP
jgi:hypothetical protein